MTKTVGGPGIFDRYPALLSMLVAGAAVVLEILLLLYLAPQSRFAFR